MEHMTTFKEREKFAEKCETKEKLINLMNKEHH
jgi:hypothetical protein